MKKGFTLIEIIVVLTIMAVLTGVAALSTKQFTSDKQLDQDTDKILNILNIAKQKTVSRDVSPNTLCTQFQGTTNVFQGYSVVFTSPSSYLLRFRCSSGNTNVSGYSYALTNTTLSPSTEVFFQYPYGMISPARTITIRNPRAGRCRQITINTNGSAVRGQFYAC